MHLQVDNVSKIFGAGRSSKLVLDCINFTVKAGEFVALVGSSGSGKSTIMRLVAGLDRPTAGEILVNGVPVRAPGSDRGMVFQKYSLYPWLSAAKNVAFGMKLQGRSERDIRERTAYFLEVVGLADAGRRMPRELSGGMQQRVAIARALAAEPQMLLLDEPLAGMGQAEAESMVQLLLRLKVSHAMMLVEHDMDAVFALADQLTVMVNGQVIASGLPAAVRADASVQAAYLGEDH
jgi:NitT/TauT family transport system ATP-binding protein